MRTLNTVPGINGTYMNSHRYLPCIALLRMHPCEVGPGVPSLSPSVFTEPAQIRFYCICLFTLISFPFHSFPIRDLQTSEAEWQGNGGFTCTRGCVSLWCVCVCVHVWVGECVCMRVTVSGDWSKIKIQIERKYWNHHFCYHQLYSF